MAPGERASLLVVEDDPFLADQLRWALKDDYRIEMASDRVKALEALDRVRPDLVLLDLCLPPDNQPREGFRVLKAARANPQGPMVLVMSATDEREDALRAIAEGAYDFFNKPVDLPTLRVVVARALERRALERENRELRQQLQSRFRSDGLIGISPAMQGVFSAIRRVADSPVTVILEGESGTGKEVVARAIHYGGSRRDGPFIAVHCGALPESLLEAELFGHEKGAFTGAQGARVGRFEAAEGGTLFLDEVATLNGAAQIKLLRVLEQRTVERLGSNRTHAIDIRLIVATNESLEAKVRRGEFREDLYFRVNVFPIRLPALRDRPEDVPVLADHFLRQICDERRIAPKRFSAEAKQALLHRPWRGNVRELVNLVQTLALLTDGDAIGVEHIPALPGAGAEPKGYMPAAGAGFKEAVNDFERQILVQAIQRAGGVKAGAARELGLDPSQMKYLVRKHGL